MDYITNVNGFWRSNGSFWFASLASRSRRFTTTCINQTKIDGLWCCTSWFILAASQLSEWFSSHWAFKRFAWKLISNNRTSMNTDIISYTKLGRLNSNVWSFGEPWAFVRSFLYSFSGCFLWVLQFSSSWSAKSNNLKLYIKFQFDPLATVSWFWSAQRLFQDRIEIFCSLRCG